MSRSIHSWLLSHGGSQYIFRPLESIMLGHHRQLCDVRGAYYALHGCEQKLLTAGIVRDPADRCWSAYVRFREQGESPSDFLKRWFFYAPADQEMLEGAELVLPFEQGPCAIFEALRDFYGLGPEASPPPPIAKPSKEPLAFTDRDLEAIRRRYWWTYDHFDY